MLSREDNELLCRIGPGTAMGELMRQYWVPAGLSSELPERDGAPLRVRLLGEDLIAFRVTSGAVGLIKNACPHRGASLFYGRNEQDGLRCVYDRTEEHLGSSDQMVIRTRKRLIDAARALRDHGEVPPGVDRPEVYGVRSGGAVLPKGADWVAATQELRKARVEHRGVSRAVLGNLPAV